MISVFYDKKDCCGCTACKSICPKQAIVMKKDEEGFLYPQINQEFCIDCGLCRKVCAFQGGYDKSQNIKIPDAYGVKHKENDIRIKSRSGGMFTAISEYILDNSGVIYGVGYKDHFVVCHKRATNSSERDEFCGSKYVQSELNDVFIQVKKDLQQNKLVLFTGTPCQTAGLNMYLIKTDVKKDKLMLCDIVCHGTPSPKVWNDFLTYTEKQFKGEITRLDFRNKQKFGWSAHRETFAINDKEYDSNIYTSLFYNHDCLRPACFNCKYTNMNRPSDITLADFWGIDDIDADFNDNKGVSLVFVNTEIGRLVFDKVKDKLEYINCTGESFIHPNLKTPTKRPISREQFWNYYQKFGFEYIVKKYARYSITERFKNVIRISLKKIGLIKLIRKVLG